MKEVITMKERKVLTEEAEAPDALPAELPDEELTEVSGGANSQQDVLSSTGGGRTILRN